MGIYVAKCGEHAPSLAVRVSGSFNRSKAPSLKMFQFGGCWQSSAGSGVPDPSSTEARPQTLPGGLFGAGYWGSSGRTLAAWGPFGPDVTSNSTAWPSSSER